MSDIVERLTELLVSQTAPTRADTVTARDTITALRAEVGSLREALANIAEATSAEADAGENYRWDDREGALDYAYATARAALTQTKDTTDDA